MYSRIETCSRLFRFSKCAILFLLMSQMWKICFTSYFVQGISNINQNNLKIGSCSKKPCMTKKKSFYQIFKMRFYLRFTGVYQYSVVCVGCINRHNYTILSSFGY